MNSHSTVNKYVVCNSFNNYVSHIGPQTSKNNQCYINPLSYLKVAIKSLFNILLNIKLLKLFIHRRT